MNSVCSDWLIDKAELATQLDRRDHKDEISHVHLEKLKTFRAGLSTVEPISVLFSCNESRKWLLQAAFQKTKQQKKAHTEEDAEVPRVEKISTEAFLHQKEKKEKHWRLFLGVKHVLPFPLTGICKTWANCYGSPQGGDTHLILSLTLTGSIEL